MSIEECILGNLNSNTIHFRPRWGPTGIAYPYFRDFLLALKIDWDSVSLLLDFSLAQMPFFDIGVTLWRHRCNALTYLSDDARIISSTSRQEIPALETNKRERKEIKRKRVCWLGRCYLCVLDNVTFYIFNVGGNYRGIFLVGFARARNFTNTLTVCSQP